MGQPVAAGVVGRELPQRLDDRKPDDADMGRVWDQVGKITPVRSDPPGADIYIRDYLKPAREAMAKVVALRMTQFGQAGHAGDYTQIPITEMARGYASGKLDTRPSLVGAK